MRWNCRVPVFYHLNWKPHYFSILPGKNLPFDVKMKTSELLVTCYPKKLRFLFRQIGCEVLNSIKWPSFPTHSRQFSHFSANHIFSCSGEPYIQLWWSRNHLFKLNNSLVFCRFCSRLDELTEFTQNQSSSWLIAAMVSMPDRLSVDWVFKSQKDLWLFWVRYLYYLHFLIQVFRVLVNLTC